MFAELYARYANATRAAKEAGYSEKGAAVQGSRMLRNPKVQRLIEMHRIDRGIHAEQTYRNLITVSNAALKILSDVMARPLGHDEDERVRMAAVETAGRQLERLARCEGLMLPPAEGQGIGAGKKSLQEILQAMHNFGLMKRADAPALPAPAAPVPTVVIDVPAPQPGGNGNGWKSIEEAAPNA